MASPSTDIRSGLYIGSFHLSRHRIALGIILLFSAIVNFYQLGQFGFPNLYYAATIRSMLENWHNWFFASFDPGGFVTVDKPPLGFWIQTASAWLFGYSPFSVLFPQALAGVCSILVLYVLVRRQFGVTTGVLAALALALTPISIATARNNTIDSLLVLTVLLAALTACLAVETRKLRWLLLCAVLLGLGFNIKMLQAYLVVPALGLFYLLSASASWRKRFIHLGLACLVMITISFSWIIAVDLVPASQRPYIGSSGDNSALTLALGYNGLSRLLGLSHGGASPAANNSNAMEPPAGLDLPEGMTIVNMGPGGSGENGEPGIFRLLNMQLGPQIGWLIPLAVIGLVVIVCQTRWRFPLQRHQQAVVLWGIWFLTMAVFFSIAGFYHTYYLVMLAPAICALSAAGIMTLWQEVRQSGWRGWLLPCALLGTALVQAIWLFTYSAALSWLFWLLVVLIAMSLLASIALFMLRLRLFRALKLAEQNATIDVSPTLHAHGAFRAALSIGIVALLIAPTIWGVGTLVRDGGAMLPIAGPVGPGFLGGVGPGGGQVPEFNAGQMPHFTPRVMPGSETGPVPSGLPGANGAPIIIGGPMGGGSTNAQLLSYLEKQQGTTTFLFATESTMDAAPYVIETGKPVMALGGFSGGDKILTTEQLRQKIEQNQVRFFLVPDQSAFRKNDNVTSSGNHQIGGPITIGGPMGNNSELVSWVESNCTVVPSETWQSASASPATTDRPELSHQLYDCKA